MKHQFNHTFHIITPILVGKFSKFTRHNRGRWGWWGICRVVNHFVKYFVSLRTNHYTFLTISPISFIFDSARNLPYRPLWRFVKIPLAWRERRKGRWEKWLAGRFTKCHLYASCFAYIFSHSRQLDDKCISVFTLNPASQPRVESRKFAFRTSKTNPLAIENECIKCSIKYT